LSAPVDAEPLIALVPVQAPEALHEVALVAVQLNVEALPLATVLGLAVKLTVGAGAETETVALWVALPPAPVQVIAKVLSAVSAPLDWEPLVALLPDQPPDAVQAVALTDDHVKIELAPLATVLGLAAMPTLTVGFALTVTVADCAAVPPSPLQVNVYVALAVRGPVDAEPLIGLLPVQAPEALHEVAWAADQFKVALLPLLIALGPTLRLTVGAADLMETVAD
jgi:hypothetical protein